MLIGVEICLGTWIQSTPLTWGFDIAGAENLPSAFLAPIACCRGGAAYVAQLIAAVSIFLGAILFGFVQRVQSNKRLLLSVRGSQPPK